MAEGHADSHMSRLSTFHLSSIEVTLSQQSKKVIDSIALKIKNETSPREIERTDLPGTVYKQDFNPPLAIRLEDHHSVSIHCTGRPPLYRRLKRTIDVDLRDPESMRGVDGIRTYRKKKRNIEIVLTEKLPSSAATAERHESTTGLAPTTTEIFNQCPRFRLLVIGNSGVGKTSLINKVFGVKDVSASKGVRGISDINQEHVSATNKRFVVHDSLGLEPGDEKNLRIVKEFMGARMGMPDLKDRVHMILILVLIPRADGRLLDAGIDKFLSNRANIFGEVPVVVVLTQVDLLVNKLELEVNDEEDIDEEDASRIVEERKSDFLNKHCIDPLRQVAGSEIPCVAVSTEEDYSRTVSELFGVVEDNMIKYNVQEPSRIAASIAQRVSLKANIEATIVVGKKKYWRMLMKSAFLGGHTMQQGLQVIHKDIVKVWNFHDADECLMGDTFIDTLLSTTNPSESSGTQPFITAFSALLVDSFQLAGDLTSGNETFLLVVPIVGIVITLAKLAGEVYTSSKRDVKIFMAFIIDLTCVMQVLFLLAKDGKVTREMTERAVQAYTHNSKRQVHERVDDFDSKLGMILGGKDHVLEKIDTIIWRHSIGDNQVDELRRQIPST